MSRKSRVRDKIKPPMANEKVIIKPKEEVIVEAVKEVEKKVVKRPTPKALQKEEFLSYAETARRAKK